MKKKFLTFLTMLFVMAFASLAVAAIPTLSRDRYLVTKIYSSSSIPVFTDSNLNIQGTAVPRKAYKASIAPNDDIYVFNYSGNSWAYVSYPTSSGRKEGYIRMSDLTPNNHWQDPQRARKTMSTYTRPGGAKYGSISNGDTVHTIAAANYRFQVVYPINNGRQYKMAWVTDADYYGYINGSKSNLQTPSIPAKANIPSVPALNTNSVLEKMKYLSQSVNGFRVNTKYTGDGECRGFANKVYTTLFSVSPMYEYSNNNYAVASYKGSHVVGKRHGDFSANDTVAMKNLFRSAKPGSFIQIGRRYSKNSTRTAQAPHSAILYRVRDDGCEFYEANAAGNSNYNLIWIKFYSWATLADRNKGFTIYEPNSYSLKP